MAFYFIPKILSAIGNDSAVQLYISTFPYQPKPKGHTHKYCSWITLSSQLAVKTEIEKGLHRKKLIRVGSLGANLELVNQLCGHSSISVAIGFDKWRQKTEVINK